MKFLKGVVHSFLIVTTPLAALPIEQASIFPIKKKSHKKSFKLPDLQTLTYDEAIHFLHQIESGSLGDDLTQEDFNQINHFVAFLAMEGSTDREKAHMGAAIDELFYESHLDYAYSEEVDALIQPASWFSDWFLNGAIAQQGVYNQGAPKKLKSVKKFIKKHKKAILIGVIVVVAVVVVTAAIIFAPAAPAAIAAGASALASMNPNPTVVSSIKEDITTFKETVAQEQFAAISDSISPEENGRIIGSMFVHKTVDTLSTQWAHPTDFTFNSSSPMPHATTDLAFSTNYASIPSWSGSNLNALSYQARGDWALSYGYYDQASQDFSNALSIEPNNPSSYLGRGVANFELGQYENCVNDYHNYLQTSSPKDFSFTDFSLGFIKELPHGAFDSGEGLVLFVSDLARHPIQTSKQVLQSLEMLRQLAKSNEWSTIGQTLSPEIHQLITQWDTLSDRKRGELSGYAFGKLGADILLPAAAAKVAKSGVTAAKELAEICKRLQNAEKLLVLEAVAEGGAAGVKVGDAICFAERTIEAAEDVGLTTKEMGALKEAGELEKAVSNKSSSLVRSQEAIEWSIEDKKITQALKPFNKAPMPEAEVRRLIHQHKVPTFPRPKGVPENFLVRITDKHGGMEYIHPTEKGTSVRVMPGMPYSEHVCQRRPYVVQKKLGDIVDINGKRICDDSPTAHISLDEFFYRE